MNFKFNWGTGILLFILLFLASMAAFLIFAFKQNFDLVEKNYYENAVNYQQHIDKKNNTDLLTGSFSIVQTETGIELIFPADFDKKTISGAIHFYSAASINNDFRFAIALDSLLKQTIPLSDLKPGRYTVKIDWKSDDKAYYSEKPFTIR